MQLELVLLFSSLSQIPLFCSYFRDLNIQKSCMTGSRAPVSQNDLFNQVLLNTVWAIISNPNRFFYPGI